MSTMETRDGGSRPENDPTGFYAEARNRLETKPTIPPDSDSDLPPSQKHDPRRPSDSNFHDMNNIEQISSAGNGRVRFSEASPRYMGHDGRPLHNHYVPGSGPLRSAHRGTFGPNYRSDHRAAGSPYPRRHYNEPNNRVHRVVARHYSPVGYGNNSSPNMYSGYGSNSHPGMYSMTSQPQRSRTPHNQRSPFQPPTAQMFQRPDFQQSPVTDRAKLRNMSQPAARNVTPYRRTESMNGEAEGSMATGKSIEEGHEDDHDMDGGVDEDNESDIFVREVRNRGFEREGSDQECVPQQLNYFNAPGRNLRPSRFSGVASPVPGEVKWEPESGSEYEVNDAAAVKRRNKGPSERVSKNASGPTDPENILIINLYEVGYKEWNEIADMLNVERMKHGKKANVTENAVRLRYNRVAPIIYKSEGKEFVSIAKRKLLKKTKRGEPGARMAELLNAVGDAIEPVWNDEMDMELAQIVKEYEAAKWDTVAEQLYQRTGVDLTAEACNLRFSSAF